MKLTLYPSKHLVKRMLRSHSWLGITLGAVLYIISLTGTILVFSPELERWEQPTIDEFSVLSPSAMNVAVSETLTHFDTTPETIYINLPTKDLPRAHVSAEGKEWFLDASGKFTLQPSDAWLHMLRELHYYLHLPHTIGMIIVGILGVMVFALILSGILSHPSIVKHAFTLRISGRARIAQTDIHNRLSVWGLPFYMMIALTGSFIGLISVLLAIAAPIYFDGDRNQAIEAVYGADPIVTGNIAPYHFTETLKDLQSRSPNAEPIYLALQKMGTKEQFLEVGAAFPDRLTYSEIFRYDTQGNYINHQGLSDGAIGRQAAYSVYRLHFGHFGGFAVKILYGIFGLALSVISVSGINIWLAKQHTQTHLHRIWAGFVWGLPLALSLSAIVGLLHPPTVKPFFWLFYTLTVVGGFFLRSVRSIKFSYQLSLIVSLIVLILMHGTFYPMDNNTFSFTVNTVLLCLAIFFCFVFFGKNRLKNTSLFST